jgi:hypothetical protein
MVRTDSDSRENRRPDGVAHAFHVIADAIEPISGLGSLLTKDDRRRSFSDEPKPLRPKVSLVTFPRRFSVGSA